MIGRIINKLKAKSSELTNKLAYSTKLKKHKVPFGQKLALCYHGIDSSGNTQFNSKFIGQATFEKQLQYYKQYFNVVSLDQFMATDKMATDAFTITLTFDDGYKNNIKYVLPLLEKYNLPATFFITGITGTDEEMLLGDYFDLLAHFTSIDIEIDTDVFSKNWRGHYLRSIDKTTLKKIFHSGDFDQKKKIISCFPESSHKFRSDPKYFDYWKQLSREEIYRLSRSELVTIGSHGYYHNDLSLLTIPAAIKEIKQSKTYLEELIQKEVVDLAFPYGKYSDALVSECKNVGFKSLIALDYNSRKRDPVLHDRFGMNPYVSWNNQLHYLLKGSYA